MGEKAEATMHGLIQMCAFMVLLFIVGYIVVFSKTTDDDRPTRETTAIHWQMVEDKNSKATTPEMAEAKRVFKAGFEAAGYTIEDLTIEISSNEEHLYALWKSDGVMYRTSVKTDNDMRPANVISYIKGDYVRGGLDGAVYDEQSGYLKVSSKIFTV